jgi:hypothetical protein
MKCFTVELGGGARAIVCGRAPRPTHCRAPFGYVDGAHRCGAHRACASHLEHCGHCQSTWAFHRKTAVRFAGRQLELFTAAAEAPASSRTG